MSIIRAYSLKEWYKICQKRLKGFDYVVQVNNLDIVRFNNDKQIDSHYRCDGGSAFPTWVGINSDIMTEAEFILKYA